MTSNFVPVAGLPDWDDQALRTGRNGGVATAASALRFLASNPRPICGSARFNSEHLLQIAGELDSVMAHILVPVANAVAGYRAQEESRFATWAAAWWANAKPPTMALEGWLARAALARVLAADQQVDERAEFLKWARAKFGFGFAPDAAWVGWDGFNRQAQAEAAEAT